MSMLKALRSITIYLVKVYALLAIFLLTVVY